MEIWLKNIKMAHHFVESAYWETLYPHMEKEYLQKCDVEVYFEEDKIVAFIVIDSDGHIISIFVDGPYQRRGIGSALIRKAKQRYLYLAISVYSKNHEAIAFCKKHGFELKYEQLDMNIGEREQFLDWRRDILNGKLQ